MAWGVATTGGLDAETARLIEKVRQSGSLCIMPFRKFGAPDCAAFCKALLAATPVCAGLTELYASGHPIGEEGAAALGAVLAAQGCTLQRLSLGDAHFGDAGVAALQSGLASKPCPLKCLDLSYKGLSETALRIIGEMFAQHQMEQLQSLTLARNTEIEDGALRAFVEALPSPASAHRTHALPLPAPPKGSSRL